jgi:hypothetical protein
MLERRIVELRQTGKLGPVRIGEQLGVAASTTHRVLVRHGLNRLAWLDRPTGRVIRRYERDRPGELVHVDTKKLGRIPDGGGWRVHGRLATRKAKRYRVGYEHVHSMVDDHSRLAYSEIQYRDDAATATAFLRRAIRFFADHHVHIERVMTDNAFVYRNSTDWHRLVGATFLKLIVPAPVGW